MYTTSSCVLVFTSLHCVFGFWYINILCSIRFDVSLDQQLLCNSFMCSNVRMYILVLYVDTLCSIRFCDVIRIFMCNNIHTFWYCTLTFSTVFTCLSTTVPHRGGTAGPFGGGASVAAVMSGKLKEKLLATSQSLLCLAMAYGNPMDSWCE